MADTRPRRKLRMIDIADRAGCSRAAVSHVLMGTGQGKIRVGKEKASLIRQIAKEMQFDPAGDERAKGATRPSLVGLLAETWRYPVQMRAFAWVEEYADAFGYQVMATKTGGQRERVKDAVCQFKARGVTGMVFLALGDESTWADAHEGLAPMENVVWAFGSVPGAKRVVACDYGDGTRQAVEHLVERGRKRIALVLEDLDTTANRSRHESFIEAMEAAGHELMPDQIYIGSKNWCYEVPDVGQRIEHTVRHLVEQVGVDAIVADDDHGAALILQSLGAMGRKAPDDVAVVGQGNELVSHFVWPKMTTVDIRVKDVMHAALDQLTSAIEEPGEPADPVVTIKPRLLVRDST